MEQLDLFSSVGIKETIDMPLDMPFWEDKINRCINGFNDLQLDDKVTVINKFREVLHENSPFKAEPVDMVKWVKVDEVVANDYNPNAVAPPEMELLRHSINHDGYTQPVVTWLSVEKAKREVIDGFHRSRVCREFPDVNKRVMGYLPVVTAKSECQDHNDRVASTIRHNRARGKHKVESMSEIVVALKKRNWTDNRICKELGMDTDEVLRLCQVSGLTEIFESDGFTKSWDIGIFEDDNDLDEVFVSEIKEEVESEDE